MCEREEVYPLGCAVARAFPQYNMKTGSSAPGDNTYLVGFLFVGEYTAPLSDEEVACLDESCAGEQPFILLLCCSFVLTSCEILSL